MSPTDQLPPPLEPPDVREELPAKRRNAIDAYVGLPQAGWSGMTVFVGALVAIGIIVIGGLVVALFELGLESNANLYATQLVVGVAFGLTAIGFAAAEVDGRLREALERLGLGRILLRIVVIAGLGWLAYVAAAALLVPILQPEQEDVTRRLGTDEGSVLSVIVAGLLIVVVAPLSEELFFRGFMYAGLRRSMPIWPAALVSGAIFGSLHLAGGNAGVAIQLAVFGVILAYLYERTGSLWAPILAHALNNTIAFVLLLTNVI